MELKKGTITKILELKVMVVKLRMKAVMVVQVVLLVVVVVVLGGLPQTLTTAGRLAHPYSRFMTQMSIWRPMTEMCQQTDR